MGWSTLGDLCIHDGKLLGCSYFQNSVGVWAADISLIEPYGDGMASEQKGNMEKKFSLGFESADLRSVSPDNEMKEIKNIYMDSASGKPVGAQNVEPMSSPKIGIPSDSPEINDGRTKKQSPAVGMHPKTITQSNNRSFIVPSIVPRDSPDEKNLSNPRTESVTTVRTVSSMPLKPTHSRRPSNSKVDMRTSDLKSIVDSSFNSRLVAEDGAKDCSEDKISNIGSVLHKFEKTLSPPTPHGKKSVDGDIGVTSVKLVKGVAVVRGRTRSLVERFEGRENINSNEDSTTNLSPHVIPESSSLIPETNSTSTTPESVHQISGGEMMQPQISEMEPLQPQMSETNLSQSQISGTELLQPQISGRESMQPQISGRESLQPQISGRESPQPQISGRESVQPYFSGRESVQPRFSGRELTRSQISRRELAQPRIAGRELLQPRIAGRELLQPQISRRELARPKISRKEFAQPRISGREAVRAQISERQLMQPQVPGRELAQTRISEREATIQPQFSGPELAQIWISENKSVRPQPQISEQELASPNDGEITETLMQNHDVFLSTLRFRCTKLQVVRHFWERNDVKGALSALRKLPDHSVQADVVSVLGDKMEILTLDLFVCLLPVLVGLLDSKTERHTIVSLELLLKLVAVFGPVIRTTISARPTVGVDLHAEYRLQCCNQCSIQLQKIQNILPVLIRRGGMLARSAQELNLVLQE